MSSLKLKTINEAGSPLFVDGGLSTPYGITVSNTLNVNSTSYISANSTFTDTVTMNAICSCATTPTLGNHLANKGYVDNRNVAKGQLVCFYAFETLGNGLSTITLPPGTYKMRVDSICSLYIPSGNGGTQPVTTITGTWGSAATATKAKSHYLINISGSCGAYIWDISTDSAVSPAFTVSTTTSNSLSINVTTTGGVLDLNNGASCRVSFYSA
jgi:hypothetical protein